MEVICPKDIRPFVTTCKNYFETLKNRIETNPQDIAFCGEIKNYAVSVVLLRSRPYTKEEFKDICLKLVELQKKLEEGNYYRELAVIMKEEIGELITLYEKKNKQN